MSYKLEEIKELAEEISKIKGVQAVLLYGSYARGDFTEGSDVDLLVVFQDKSSLKKRWRMVTETTAKRKFFVQAVTMIPLENMTELINFLEKEGAHYVIRYVWCD